MSKSFISLSLVLAMITSLLTGCATNYEGPGPNYALKGDAAQREIENFTIDPSYFYHSVHVYQMGAEGSSYFASSLAPIVREVSPSAAKKLEHAKWWDYANLAFLAAAIGVVVAKNDSWSAIEGPYFTLLGLAIGSGIYANITVSNALEEYDKALPGKFAPQAGVAISY